MKIDPTMSRQNPPRHLILVLLCYCMATGGVLVVGPATCLSTMAADLDMALDAQKGLFLGAPFWGLAVIALFSGWLAQRLGYRLLMLASAAMQTTGLVVVASAVDQPQAMAGSILLGLGRGMLVAPLTALLCSIYPDNRTGIANIFHAFFHIGTAALIGLVLVFFHLDWSWRDIFRCFAALIAPCGLVGFVVPLPGAVRMADRSDRLRHVARQAGFGLIVAAVFFSGMIESGPTTWLPYFVEEAVGTSRSFGAVGLLCFALTMVCGRLSVPLLVRRWGAKWIFVGGGLLSATSVVMASLPLGIYSTMFWLTLLGLAVSGLFPTVIGYAGDRFPTAHASLFAVVNSSAILGVIAAPAAVGVVADYLGLRPAMASLALAALVFLVIISRLLKTPAAARHAHAA